MGKPRLAVLGCGKMGEAILAGLRAAGDDSPVEQTVATTRRADVAARLAERLGLPVLTDNAAAARMAEVVVLATKPQVAGKVLRVPGVAEALADTLVVSLCAGVTTEQLAELVPRARIVRAMPNTPALIREGMTVISPGPNATEADLALVRALFLTVGRVRELEEKHLDVVTALSGSGPAFACVVLEALADGGVMMGLPRDVALELAAQSMQGAARLVLQTGRHPASLKDEVTTPAGCTIAGLLVMEDGRIRSTMARTIEEASRVAAGLGKS